METYYVTISMLVLYSKSAKTFLNTSRVPYFVFYEITVPTAFKNSPGTDLWLEVV